MDPKISFCGSARKRRISWHLRFLTFTCLPPRNFWHVFEKNGAGRCAAIALGSLWTPRWPPTGRHSTKIIFHIHVTFDGKSILQVPDTCTRGFGNTRPRWHSIIVCFWMPPARCKECKYHIYGQYWYKKNVPVFTNTGTFQYLGPEVYFSPLTFGGYT